MGKRIGKRFHHKPTGSAFHRLRVDETLRDADQGRKEPSHLVIFHESSDHNTGVVSEVLSVGAAPENTAMGAGIELLCSPSESHAHHRMFHKVGVCCAHLADHHVEKLKKHDRVRAVVKNERRPGPTVVHGMGNDAGDPHEDAAHEAAEVANARSWCLDEIGLSTGSNAPTGKGVKVAVLDTGLDFDHPDFINRPNIGNEHHNNVDGETIEDENGHGTHVAGTIAGPIQSNGDRRYGVAPDAELLICKVLDKHSNGVYDSKIIEAIEWAAQKGARVISMSLGSPREVGDDYASAYENIASILLEDDGVLIVAASGNFSSRTMFTKPVGNPAACPSLMAVGGVRKTKTVSTQSACTMDSIGIVDIAAPGVKVYSAFAGGGYAQLTGTSQATPHVAGVAALLIQSDPTLKGTALWKKLKQSALTLPGQTAEDVGAGLVQAPPAT
jgi:subtilisin family serine protease